jgi:hypothetical protein
MIRKPLALLSVAASVGILAAGCGGSSTTTVTAAAPTTTAAAPTTTTTSANTGSNTGNTGSSSTSAASANPQVQQLVSSCKARINSASGLSSSVVSKLQALCNQAANGNEASARKAAAQVCTEIIKATVPQQAQQFALANCPKA